MCEKGLSELLKLVMNCEARFCVTSQNALRLLDDIVFFFSFLFFLGGHLSTFRMMPFHLSIVPELICEHQTRNFGDYLDLNLKQVGVVGDSSVALPLDQRSCKIRIFRSTYPVRYISLAVLGIFGKCDRIEPKIVRLEEYIVWRD